MEKFSPFLDSILDTKDYRVLPLAGDASSRRYYRVVAEDKAWVLMEWEPFSDPDNFPFLSVQKYFSENKIRVPEVYKFCTKSGLFLLEDLGDLTLERRFWEFQNQENILPFYKATIDELISIHSLSFRDDGSKKCTAYHQEFSVEKFMWEFNYTKKHLIQGLLNYKLGAKEETELNSTFLKLCEKLYTSPQVVCHRDFHSRNVMLRHGKVTIIDFQDARMGPPVYDLVSLFYDSYVELSDGSVGKLMEYYIDNFPYFNDLGGDRDEFLSYFSLQSIQRCFKACGSFASFKMNRNDNRYLDYIEPTLNRVSSLLEFFPEYAPMRQTIEALREKWEQI